MAGGLYARVSARGFPSSVAEGVTGEGALASQGGTVDPAHGQQVTAQGQYTTVPGFAPEGPAPLAVDVLEGTWGLPGELTNPDQTPRTHAAPAPGWAGSYAPSADLENLHTNSVEIHSVDFGALTRRTHSPGAEASQQARIDQWTSNSPGEAVGLVPLTGPARVLGGMDAVQGYDLRNRFGFDAGHRDRVTFTDPQPSSFLDPAERPFVVPQASGTFTPTDEVQGPDPAGTYLDAGNVNATPPTAYEPPPAPATLATAPAGAPAAAGWWS